MWGAAPILFCCGRCSGTLAWARPAAATPAGAGPAASPPARVAVPSGGGGHPLGSRGGGGPLLWLPSWGGCGGGGGGAAPPPPRPVGRRPPFCCPRRAPPGVYSCRGGCRAAASVGRGLVGRRRVSAAGGGGGGEGGNPPSLVRAPVFPGPASDKAAPFAPSWASPVCCRPAAGRACGRLPRPWCPRTPGAAASSGGSGAAVSSVRLRPLLGLSGRGGGSEGGPLVPWRRLLTARGGGGMAVPAPGASHGLGGRTLPPPPST